MLCAVDEDDRDVLAVPAQQGRVAADLGLLPADAELAAHLCDDRTSVVAEMAAGPAQEPYPRFFLHPSCVRDSRRDRNRGPTVAAVDPSTRSAAGPGRATP